MSIASRLRAAYKAFQPVDPVAVIGEALRLTKAVPFPTGGGGGEWSWPGWNSRNQWNTNIDYQREAGPLTGSSLVMAAVNWFGTTLPEAPVQVLQGKSPKVWEPVMDHPMVDLLQHPTRYLSGDNVRQWYSGELLWKAFSLSWIIDGNVYFRKMRNAMGQPIQLWYEPHFSIRPRWPQDGSEFISYYEVLRNGRWYRIESDDVIHFRYGIDPYNDRLGLSGVASLYREVFTDNERARYSALILKNGGVIPWTLSPESGSSVGIKPEEIKAEFEYATTGDNVGRPMVFSGPVKVQNIGLSPDKLLVDKASQIPEERIAAVIGIPAAVLGFGVGLDQTKVGATMREMREQAYESFVLPNQRIIAGELESQLLPDFGETKGLKVAHDLSQVRVLQDDREKLFTRETLAYEKGVKTRAEARSALGLDTSDADNVFWMPSGITLISPEERGALAVNPLVSPSPQLLNGKDQMVN